MDNQFTKNQQPVDGYQAEPTYQEDRQKMFRRGHWLFRTIVIVLLIIIIILLWWKPWGSGNTANSQAVQNIGLAGTSLSYKDAAGTLRTVDLSPLVSGGQAEKSSTYALDGTKLSVTTTGGSAGSSVQIVDLSPLLSSAGIGQTASAAVTPVSLKNRVLTVGSTSVNLDSLASKPTLGTLVSGNGLTISGGGVQVYGGGASISLDSATALVSGDVTGSLAGAVVTGLRGTPVATNSPLAGQALIFDGANWTATSLAASPTTGNLSSNGTVTVSGGAGAILGSGAVISLPSVGSAATYGSSTSIPVFTTDANGRVTAVSNTSIPLASVLQTGLLSASDYATFAAKQNALPMGTAAQYLRGNQTVATLDTSVVPENGNLYWTAARFNSAFSMMSTDNLPEGVTNMYFTNGRADARINLQKGVANGVASLDSSGKVPNSQLPSVAITNTFVVSSNAAMLALSANQGDVAVRTDVSKTYILQQVPPSNSLNWIEMLAPGSPVQSVNGQTGTVNLLTTNVGEGSNLYYTDARARAAFSASGPLALNSGTGALTISQATASSAGYLTLADWNTFNGKESGLTFNGAGMFSRSGNTISATTSCTTGQSLTFDGTNWLCTTPLTGNFINNNTVQQANANFNIQSAAAGSVGGVISGASGQTADIFDIRNSAGLNLAAVSASGAVTFQNASDSTSAVAVKDASGTNVMTVDTANHLVQVLTSGPTNSGLAILNSDGTTALEIRAGGSGLVNSFVGTNSGSAVTTGSGNSGFGSNALRAVTSGTNNTALGQYSLQANTTGINNVGVGQNTLSTNTTGNNNTAVGKGTMYSNTTGSRNTAVGNSALGSNTSGIENTALGYTVLNGNTTGGGNTGIGNLALNGNTTGSFNTATGTLTLYANTTGVNNTANGNSTLRNNTTGNNNAGYGNSALFSNTSASNNTAMGTYGLYTNTTGTNNAATGYNSLYLNLNGSNNTANGVNALYGNSTASGNTATGASALYYNVSGANNTALGYNANSTFTPDTANALTVTGVTTGAYGTNTFTVASHPYTVGTTVCMQIASSGTTPTPLTAASITCYKALSATTLSSQTAITGTGTGTITLTPNFQYTNSTAIGYNSNVTASNQIALGDANVVRLTTAAGIQQTNSANANYFLAGVSIGTTTAAAAGNLTVQTTSATNPGISVLNSDGTTALEIRAGGTGQLNSFVGATSGQANTTGTSNTGLGNGALFGNTTGYSNTGIGARALYTNTSGYNNTAVGQRALYSNTTGFSNTAVGQQALTNNTTGSRNTAVGQNSLLVNTTGQFNTAVGQSTLQSNTTGSSNTAIGQASLDSNTTGTNNTGLGMSTLTNNTTGQFNTASGSNSLYYNSTGTGNTVNGYNTMFNNIGGSNNTTSGIRSLQNNVSGSGSTAGGSYSLQYQTSGNNNTAFGNNAFGNFVTDTANTKTVSAVTTGVQGVNTFTITGHGFTVGDTVCPQVNSTGANPAPLNNGTPYCFYVSDANTLSSVTTITAVGSGTITLVPLFQYTNSTAIGYNSSITASNQIALGDANVVRLNTAAGVQQTNAANTNYFLGNMGIGTSSPGVKLDVLGSGANGTTVAQFKNAGATTCSVQPGGTGFACSSDARLKKDVSTIDSALDTVDKLNGVTYRWNDIAGGDTGLQYGFIAQEVQKIIPTAVTTGSNGYLQLNPNAVTPILVNAIQELNTKVDTIKAGTLATLANADAVSIKGNLTVGGDLYVNGKLQVGKDSAGVAAIKAGKKTVHIAFNQAYPAGKVPKVVATPQTATTGGYAVSNITVNGFDLVVTTAQPSDINFNWIALAGGRDGVDE